MTDLNFTIEQLNSLFQSSKDFVFFMKKVGDDYRYEFVNNVALNNIPNMCVGKTLKTVMDKKLSINILKYYDEALEKNEQQQFQDYTMFTLEVKKYETTVYPIQDSNGQYILAITRLIAFDRNVEDKYLFMRSVFFKTFLSTVLVSKNFELLEANPAFLNDFAISIEDVRGKRLDEIGLISEQNISKYLKLLKDVINGEKLNSEAVKFTDRNGEQRNFMASFSPLTDEEDEVIAVFIIMQETTDYLKQKEELRNTSHVMEIMKRALSTTADISFTDTKGCIVDVNQRFIERTGYTREELIGKTHNILNSGFHPQEFFSNLWHTISSGEIWRGEVCNKTKQGVTYWNEATIIPLKGLDGEIFQFLGVYFNVSEKKQMMTELRRVERIFRLITENTNDLIVIFNEKGIISYTSPSYIRLLGIPEEELIGMSYQSLISENSIEQWYSILDIEAHQQDVVELELKLPNNETVWTECHFKVSVNERIGSFSEITMVSRIITDRKKYENQLMFMAYHDSLTHLPNRRYLEKEFPHLLEMANAQFQSIAVIYVDGDNFKSINDTYGHDVGDDFIRNFSQVLQRSIRSDDLVVRMGGDEFVIILNGLSRDEIACRKEIEASIKRVKQNLQLGWVTDGVEFSPTSTMGVAIYPEHSHDLNTLIDFADQMLFEAKSVKRNSHKIFAD